MSKMIDKDKLLMSFKSQCCGECWRCDQRTGEGCGVLLNQPSVEILDDGRPVAHWVYDENAHDWNLGGWVCSRCRYVNDSIPTVLDTKKGRIGHDKINPYAFNGSWWCAGCGAKMREEK